MFSKFPIIILVGGYGTRISRFTKKVPKPMIKITKNYFLKDLVNNLAKYNFKKIYLLGYYKFDLIKEEFHNTKVNLIPIECIKEKKKLGTGGALYFLKKKLKNDFFLVNGDTFFDIDYNKFLKFCLKNDSLINIALTKKNSLNKKLNQITVNKNKVDLSTKGKFMNGGIYFCKNKILKDIQFKELSLENEIIENLIKQKKVSGMYFDNYFLDIGSYISIKKAKKKFIKFLI